MTCDLSILIPARNEIFLARTIQDLLENIEGNTEILVGLDGAWSDPILPQDPRVTVIYRNESIGQRAMTNELCRLSKSKYVMKVDAHCAFDKGFDVKMIKEMHDDWTMIPLMYNLHAFDWVCSEGHRRYQGPSDPCEVCGKEMTKDIIWKPRLSRGTHSWRFDNTLHFQYFGEFNKRPEAQGDIVETMSAQGSCFMLTREKYWELNISDEAFGSWGQQGVEVACKTWLSGGRLVVNKKTWYSHMFRTQGRDFGFPYPNPESKVEKAREYSRKLFLDNTWPLQVRPLSWLVDKFKPVPGWHDESGKDMLEKINQWGKKFKNPYNPTHTTLKAIVYYTHNTLNIRTAVAIRKQISKSGLPVVCVSTKPTNFGKNIVFNDRGMSTGLAIAKKILIGLENTDADIIFFAEHDVLYHPSHFEFVPPKKDVFYYNENVWQVRAGDGHALYYDCKKLSQLCAYKELLIKHFQERVRRIEAEGFSNAMGYEPGTHNRKERVDDYKAEAWRSPFPSIDIRHDSNATASRWNPEEFRSQNNCQNWKEADEIAGWGVTKGRFEEILKQV
jgi:hypothetical protein